jgi:hypothetical protein
MSRTLKIVSAALALWPLAVQAQATPPQAGETPGDQPTVGPPVEATVTPPAPPPSKQSSSNFMDTRLAFTCAHEDMLRDAKVLPSAPGFHCGRPNSLGVLFFDNYDTRFSGFETLSHLALYKHWAKEHWEIEGGVVIRVNEFSEENIRLSDGGSYIRAAYHFDATGKEKTQLALVAFPVSSDRMRLGFSYRISWGGSPEFFKPNPDVPGSSGKNPESVPGAKLQLDLGNAYAYVGVKSTLLLDPVINEKRGVLAFLAGAGWDVSEMLRVEANGGVFDRGKNEAVDVLGEPVTLYGASAQVVLHQGIPVGSSIDYALYRNEPESIARLFRKESYPGGFSWLVSPEVTVIRQTLKDPEMAGSTRTQMGLAADLNVRLKMGYTRVRLDVMTRDLAFILHSIPSLPTYWDFPDTYDTTNEIFGAVGVDHFFPDLQLTTGVTVGGDLPATLTTPTASEIPGNLTTSSTLVVRNESSRSVLPEGADVALIWAVKGTVRKDFGDVFAALVDVYYQYDPNTVRYDRSSSEGSFNMARFASFDQLGFDVTLQARF